MLVDRWSTWLDVTWVASVGMSYLSVCHFELYIILCCMLGYSSLGLAYYLYQTGAGEKPDVRTTCPICLDEVDEAEDEEIVWCTRCKKTYHIPCALEWFKYGSTCPNCRKIWGLAGLAGLSGLSGNLPWPFEGNLQNIEFGGCLVGIYFVLPYFMTIVLPVFKFMSRNNV